MSIPIFFNAKNTNCLFGLKKDFNFLQNLYQNNNLPKVLLLSGKKGIGKFTLVNNFLLSVFDKKNYDMDKLFISSKSNIFNQIINNTFPNLIYLNGSAFKSVKIDDIRKLKKIINQTSILNKHRFIIFDDIELFNSNSLSALLKMIEEPGKNNYYILINNKRKLLLDTIKSRSLEVNIILNEKIRLEIIDQLIKTFKLKRYLDPVKSHLSPGNFVKFNHICVEENIDLDNDFIHNLNLLFNIYNKKKEELYFNLIFFITEYYFNIYNEKKIYSTNRIFEIRNFVFEHLNNFLLYNVNQNSLISVIESKLNNE